MVNILKTTFFKKIVLLSVILLSHTLVFAQHLVLNSYTSSSVTTSPNGSITLMPGFVVPSGSLFWARTSNITSSPYFMATPSNNLNYTSSRVFKIAGIKTDLHVNQIGRTLNEVNESIEYTDGLGRMVQSIIVQGSPSGKDIVQAAEYDAAGRQSKKYLPYTSNTIPGSFKPGALAGTAGYGNSEQYNFYQQTGQGYKTNPYPYAERVLEPNVFNRQEQGGVGAPWQPANGAIPNSGHTKKTDLGLSTDGDAIKKWAINGNTIEVDNNGFFAGLIKQSEKDANWVSGKAGTKETFIDANGRLIAQKIFDTELTAITTYYVYDPFNTGKVRYVLAPSIVANSFVEGDTTFNRHVYAYHYDDDGRVIEKKSPGGGWDHVVYNKLDQPVLSQDSVQRTKQEWTFIKYDAFGRVILSGRYQNASSRSGMQTILDNTTVNWENKNTNGTYGYTNNSFPTNTNIAEVYDINYYDDYELPSSCPWQTMPLGSSPLASGLPTATLTKVLNTNTYLWSVNYYDNEAQLIITKSQNNLNGQDEYYNYYRFSGEVDSVKRISLANGVNTTIREKYDYDHMGRLLQAKQQINSQPEVILFFQEYNELGQLISKKLHSIDGGINFLQTINHGYNEQGWPTAINNVAINASDNAKFGLELKYDDANSPQYNGNIGQSKWKVARTNSSPQLGYDHKYDKVNRLTASESYTGNTKDNNYSEYTSYDQLGNIRRMGRYALLGGNRLQIDSLQYTYDAAKHTRIDNLSSNTTFHGFKELTQTASEYIYDGNGRMIADANSGIDSIVYNVANLPARIVWAGSNHRKLEFKYTPSGEKLQKIYTNGSNVLKIDYNAGIQYLSTNGGTSQIIFIQTSEGVARNNGGNFKYEYNLTDHLGNVRAIIDADPSDGLERTARVIQEGSYYPFGMAMPSADISFTSGEKNNYLYNGKELQEELGQYDYGFRFYNPAIGRWSVPDPLAEKHYDMSSYQYVMNNPMLYIDPLGLDTTIRFKDYDIDIDGHSIVLDGVTIHGNKGGGGGNADLLGLRANTAKRLLNAFKEASGFVLYDPAREQREREEAKKHQERLIAARNEKVIRDKYLNNANDVIGMVDKLGNAAALGKDFLLESRNALPIMARVGMSNNLKMASKLGAASKLLGPAAYVGGVFTTALDYQAMDEGRMSGARFSYNTLGTSGGLVVGAVAGAVPGVVVGATFVTGQILYDGFNSWSRRLTSDLYGIIGKMERSIPRPR